MAGSNDHAGVSYFFKGDFLPYRRVFEMRCPPPMKLHKGMCVSKSGEAHDWMYYLCRGTLRVYAGNCEGNERTVAILGEDSLAGLDCFLPGEASIMNISCMTDCWLMPLQNTAVEDMVRKDPDFAATLTRYYCRVLRQLCFDAANQSLNSVFLRLANFLLTNWTLEDNRVRLSQQDLAYAINSSRASISRACRLMKQEGIIATESIGFRILDPARLRELCMACETT